MKCKEKLVNRILSIVALSCLFTSCANTGAVVQEQTGNKKLKIVFMMGQSNMVGHFNPSTAWYLTQPIYTPPPKTATVKSQDFDWEYFYWTGLRFANGSAAYNSKAKALLEERNSLRKLWRSRVYSDTTGFKNDWKEWKQEWGPRPGKNGENWRQDMQRFLHQKAREIGLYQRMEAHIESPENTLHPKKAIRLIAERDKPIADDLKRVRDIFLKGTTPEDFDKLDEAIKPLGPITVSNRTTYAKVLENTINLPIAKQTYISAFGGIAGSPAQGVLSVGYTTWPANFGPEYPFGISFERLIDGPVLIIKCAVGGTSLKQNWRPPSLATDDEPMGPLLKESLAHIRGVLENPGNYHPDYDPKEGHEIAGMVWFQGWNDAGNEEYGEQLVHFIKDLRKEWNAPNMPVICGLLGHASWERNTFDGDVNSGMLYAAKHPDLKGTVDIVNTVKYYPIELGLLKSVGAAYGKESEEYKQAESIIKRATSKDGTHYHGAAKFAYLTGDAMARKLANLLNGGEPTIFEEAARILGEK
jgi:hypothetical protein